MNLGFEPVGHFGELTLADTVVVDHIVELLLGNGDGPDSGGDGGE